ncbi:MAG: FAD-binding protein, partial [Oscillospiraceae bacterium]
ENGLLCERLLEDKKVTLSVPLPAVVTVSGGYLLRPPSIAGMRAAKEKQVKLLTAEMLGIPPELAGTRGSATQVRRVWPAEAPLRHCRIYRDISEGADAVIEFLQKDRVREVSERVTPAAPADGTAVVVSLSSDALSKRCAPELMTAAKSVYRNAVPVLLEDAGGDDVSAATALCGYIEAEKPDCVLFPATVRGRAVAPLSAAMLGIGLTADCTGLEPDGAGGVSMIRPTFGGSVMAEVICRTKPAMASVRPGVFEPDADMPEAVRISVPEGGVKRISESAAEVPALDIGVKIIVSGGRGVGKKENFEKLGALALMLGGVLTGSRQAVDGGFLPYPRQVGQTGATVRPDFYIACGISGTVQHMAGVRTAGVVAVNSDPKARIFDYAEIGIVGDCMEFADILINKLSAGG